jgi:hypothetical protein
MHVLYSSAFASLSFMSDPLFLNRETIKEKDRLVEVCQLLIKEGITKKEIDENTDISYFTENYSVTLEDAEWVIPVLSIYRFTPNK